MEEHQDGSNEQQAEVDRECSSNFTPKERQDVEVSQKVICTENNENLISPDDDAQDEATPQTTSDESNDSSRHEISMSENIANAFVADEAEPDEGNSPITSVPTDRSETNETTDNSNEEDQNQMIETDSKIDDNDRQSAIKTVDNVDDDDQNHKIESTASDNSPRRVDDAETATDDSTNEFDAKDYDLEIAEDSFPSREKEPSEPEVPNGDDTVLNEVEAEQEALQVNDSSVENQGTIESSADESEFHGFDSVTIEISLEKTNELIQSKN